VPGYGSVVGKGAPVRVPSPPTEVDLHRLLVWGPLGVRVPPDELWVTARSLPIGDRELPTLGLEESLLHAAYHLLVGGTPRALSLRDVAQLLTRPALDVDRTRALAARWGAEAVLATAVIQAVASVDLAGGGGVDAPEVPEAAGRLMAWAHGYPIGRRDALWLRIYGPDHALVGLEAIATYLELRTPPERRMLRAATLRPAPGTWPGPWARAREAGRQLIRRP